METASRCRPSTPVSAGARQHPQDRSSRTEERNKIRQLEVEVSELKNSLDVALLDARNAKDRANSSRAALRASRLQRGKAAVLEVNVQHLEQQLAERVSAMSELQRRLDHQRQVLVSAI